jgi:hypothetical protein
MRSRFDRENNSIHTLDKKIKKWILLIQIENLPALDMLLKNTEMAEGGFS